MNSTLKMLLPRTFPTARSDAPEEMDCSDTATSGALVPKATTVANDEGRNAESSGDLGGPAYEEFPTRGKQNEAARDGQ